MRKLWVSVAVAVFLFFALGDVVVAGSKDSSEVSVGQKLSSEQIRERFAEINSKYEIGQPFTEEDAEFVRAYASPEAQTGVSSLTQKSFTKTGSGYGLSLAFWGTVWVNKGTLNHSYGGNITASILSGFSKWQSTSLHITHSAYGIVGSGGIGLVYSGQIDSPTVRVSPYSMNQSKQYTAFCVLYSYTNAYCVVGTTSGSFSIYAF